MVVEVAVGVCVDGVNADATALRVEAVDDDLAGDVCAERVVEALAERDEHSAALARNAVVIVLLSERNGILVDAHRIADGFTGIARAAVTIPFDRALHGGALRYDAVATNTQNAWLAAGAAVAAGL